MKKPKFIFKVNQDNTAKVYCGGKWHNHVTDVMVYAKPQDISVCITKYKTNKYDKLYVVDNEIPQEVKCFHFGKVK